MKSLGVIRIFDTLGRVVIPKEYRNHFDMENAPVEITADANGIHLKKYDPNERCIFCGEDKGIVTFKNKKICMDCYRELEGKNE